MTAPNRGKYELVLRVDIDPRHANSPVMNRISGDVFQKYRFEWRGETYEWRVYRESWIVDEPSTNWQDCYVDVKGSVRYWEGSHPSTRLELRIPWGTLQPAGPAEVTLRETGNSASRSYTCQRESDAFRDLTLEVDVCESVNTDPVLPEYDTHAHNTRPPGLPQRTLTIEEAYREAGVDLTLGPGRTVIDDSASTFNTWSVAELHDAMETHFSQYSGGWPSWNMWGLLASEFDSSSTAGIMFDARASYGGAGEPPERQGFAVFGEHSWFDDLPTDGPANQTEADAMRQYLYTWVHEAGHAFNFLHSWDKGRPQSLSWMNYPYRVSNFWQNFEFRFDDEELIHMRHGNRNAVIMGGDAWATGGHLRGNEEIPLDRLSRVEGNPPVELLVRSSDYVEFLEPVEIELRLRNLMDDRPVDVDSRLRPEFGNVTIFIRRPDDTVVRYKPVVHQMGERETITLKAPSRATEGEDRYSQRVFVGYGKDGAYFDQPGQYAVRAAYQDQEDLLVVSETHTFRVGTPQSRTEDRLASSFFSDEVGLALSFAGSRSPYLQNGMAVLEEVAEEMSDDVAGAKAATTIAASLKDSFFSVRDGSVTKLEDAQPERALEYTDTARNVYRRRDDKSLNIAYNELARTRAGLLKQANEEEQAKEEVEQLREDLADRGVNQPVLDDIERFGDSL
ncbi:hypothetical protein [Halorussus pelagicus]|uniref:hypothetical protein n=1 Tax=Halorussus pelagicus TaxID=2505977 RepID=UPI000FFC2C6A|nr:hypothetical protein [Halorussus pelagicus]